MLRKALHIPLWILTVAFIASCTSQPPHYQSIDITGANYQSNVELTDQNGKRRMV